jgi:hypothetical protein
MGLASLSGVLRPQPPERVRACGSLDAAWGWLTRGIDAAVRSVRNIAGTDVAARASAVPGPCDISGATSRSRGCGASEPPGQLDRNH